jgi:hypothetical protein
MVEVTWAREGEAAGRPAVLLRGILPTTSGAARTPSRRELPTAAARVYPDGARKMDLSFGPIFK